MKKLMMAATLAALTFGAAQAATLQWQATGNYDNKAIISGTGSDHCFSHSFDIDVAGCVSSESDLVKFGYLNGAAFLQGKKDGGTR